MYSLRLLCTHLLLLAAAALLSTANPTSSHAFNCNGGSLYFTAHPADVFLYQNPDLFHDLYVYRCVTTVVFTSGDRGIVGNHSRSLEQGMEAAYSWMSGDDASWQTDTLRIGENDVKFSTHSEAANMQIVYLRLPDGGPAGRGYEVNGGESLPKLYKGDIETITTIDGNATYTLASLGNLIAAILYESNATDVRVLDYKTGIPDDEDARSDHADHVVSARLVVDIMKREKSKATLQGYAGSFARRFDSNLNETGLDFKRKVGAFLKYAEYDQHMCQSYDECLNNLKDDVQHRLFQDHDVLYAAEALEREYYVS
ncbi:hypothetical protein EKO04_006749 [Ascochyta lentis]|uniref:Uncharacterized protein n=1 Tax=Ascochyta lentis TaxID=205686 RepID=A0A8H7J285_9PLEO|nr:hypothetical protein EKO04_006749 [Ascochyta lentis]